MKVIVLAGGCGNRLWPLSSHTFPKQFLNFNRKSLLCQTVNRFAQEKVVVVTCQKYLQIVQKQLGSAYKGAILVEPRSKNTAPAICLSVKYLLEKIEVHENTFCMVCPSDHYFGNGEDIKKLLPLAQKGAAMGSIVTFGIAPTSPETEYGYMQTAKGKGLLSVTQFIEKPKRNRAQKLIKEGRCYWNAGVFMFQIASFVEQLREYAPDFFCWFSQPYEQAIATFPSLPSISIEHALMEKSSRILLIPYLSHWSDLGSWHRLVAQLPKDTKGNFFQGEMVKAIDTNRCIAFGNGIKMVGVQDLLIIKTKGQVVICHRNATHYLPELQEQDQLFP